MRWPLIDTTISSRCHRSSGLVARAAGFARPPDQTSGPAADGLVADAQTSRGQQILDVSVAQGEPQIEPNCVANDFGWEAVAGVGNGAHHHSYPIQNATVTMPIFDMIDIIPVSRQHTSLIKN